MGKPDIGWRLGDIPVKILVTGASSLIGRHIVSRLVERGDQVTVLQRGPSGIAGVTEVCCDIASSGQDTDKVTDKLMANALEGRDAVIHLAAKVSIAGRWDAFEAINIRGVERLINLARHGGVGRFVHVSTPSVAHAGRSLTGAPAGPADPDHVRGHYARSKAIGERIALAANGKDMKVVALRPHLVWGPGDTQLVQRIVDRALAGRLVLVGSALALIDTTYIDNAAEAVIAGVDNAERAAGHALVISNGQPRTVNDIMQRILRAAGIDTRLRHVPAGIAITAGAAIERIWDMLDRQDDPPMTRFLAEQLATAHWFDQRETRRLLDWQPTVSIEEGFARLTAFNQGSSRNSGT